MALEFLKASPKPPGPRFKTSSRQIREEGLAPTTKQPETTPQQRPVLKHRCKRGAAIVKRRFSWNLSEFGVLEEWTQGQTIDVSRGSYRKTLGGSGGFCRSKEHHSNCAFHSSSRPSAAIKYKDSWKFLEQEKDLFHLDYNEHHSRLAVYTPARGRPPMETTSCPPPASTTDTIHLHFAESLWEQRDPMQRALMNATFA